MPITTTLNNVDLEAVAGLTEKIQREPTTGETNWTASVRWLGGFKSEATIRGFDPVTSDEPPALGGTDTGPNPVEQLLGALGNCLAVGYAANATAAGLEIDELTIDLDGDLDLHAFLGLTEGNAGYERINVSVNLVSNATTEQLQALHHKVVSTSPVGHTLSRAVPTQINLAG